jgi:hypothetical protein
MQKWPTGQTLCPVRTWGASSGLPVEKLPAPTVLGSAEPSGQKRDPASACVGLPPQASARLEVEPAGQWYPAVHGPLHVDTDWRSAHPKLPGLQGYCTPLTQKLPLGHGTESLRVALVGPTVYLPGGATSGSALPSGQYTSAPPHGT